MIGSVSSKFARTPDIVFFGPLVYIAAANKCDNERVRSSSRGPTNQALDGRMFANCCSYLLVYLNVINCLNIIPLNLNTFCTCFHDQKVYVY